MLNEVVVDSQHMRKRHDGHDCIHFPCLFSISSSLTLSFIFFATHSFSFPCSVVLSFSFSFTFNSLVLLYSLSLAHSSFFFLFSKFVSPLFHSSPFFCHYIILFLPHNNDKYKPTMFGVWLLLLTFSVSSSSFTCIKQTPADSLKLIKKKKLKCWISSINYWKPYKSKRCAFVCMSIWNCVSEWMYMCILDCIYVSICILVNICVLSGVWM